jgi:endonuclease/exonuclease/phosphatase family metal-dependent hydrolase
VSNAARLDSVSARASFRSRRFLRWPLIGCAFAYPAVLLVLSLGLCCIGERWWVTAAGLYAPRLPFVIPLPLLALCLWFANLRRLLWTQLLAAFFAIALLGFVLPWPSRSRVSAPTLRVLSFNVNSGRGGPEAIANAIAAESPDVVLLQEAPSGSQLVDALRQRYPFVASSTQFVVASRYHIASSEPARVAFYGRLRSPRFMRYVIDAPLGQLAVYSVHPISPRGVLHVHQLRAAFHELRTGELFAGDPEADMRANTGLRALQIETAAEQAGREALPVLIAGDTNLPALSAVLRKNLSGYSDGFRTASWGLGYTFPSNHPFLRLDRILTGRGLGVVSFEIGCQGVSDHLCVVADVEASR